MGLRQSPLNHPKRPNTSKLWDPSPAPPNCLPFPFEKANWTQTYGLVQSSLEGDGGLEFYVLAEQETNKFEPKKEEPEKLSRL